MTQVKIDLAVKRQCVEMSKQGKSARNIYDEYFCKAHPQMGYETFRHHLKYWKRKQMADTGTQSAGTYPGFVAHGATVQVNGNGEIVQAWLKQHKDDGWYDELLEAIRENTTPRLIERLGGKSEPQMLEIPLFDQHFPISDHEETLQELLEIIRSRRWEEINIVLGQDMLHNDDMRGRTSSGRQIESVNMVKAWNMARDFWYTAISACLEQGDIVKVIYSKGNHDESMSWAFVQMLKAMFPQVGFDDSMAQRKCISWRNCFIGVTHGAYKKSTKNDLRGQFTIQFAEEFARAKVREIHAGHLHNEEEKDIYGVMCRRLSRNGETDEWSDDEGFVGANQRFMVFRWKPGRLAGIEYI